jgi:hypothetical protein
MTAYPISGDRRWSNKGVELEKGSRFETMYWGHLPKHIMDEIDKDVLEDIKSGRYLVIYFRRKYLLVSRNEIELVKW